MKRRTVKVFSMIFCIMMICMTLLPLTAFAEGDTMTTTRNTTCVVMGDDITKVGKAFTTLKTKYNNRGNVQCESDSIKCLNNENKYKEIIHWGNNTITFYYDNYENADKDARVNALKYFSNALKDADVSTTCRQNIADCLQDGSSEVNNQLIGLAMDSTTADIFTALKWLSPILQFMRIIIGVGAIVIVILLIASTVMDCVYIGLPMWREQQANKDGGNGKPFGVSMEALSTVKEVESNIEGGKYKNAYLVYFRRRALTYIILAICILYLIAGELGGLIQGLLNMVSGFTS